MGVASHDKTDVHPSHASNILGETAEEEITRRIVPTTLGEQLIPLLLLVGETVVGYSVLLGLAVSLTFAGDASPLLPFWGLLLIMLIFYGVGKLFRKYAPKGLVRKIVEPLTWLLLVFGFALFFTWLNNYASTISFFSPRWLLAREFIPTTQSIVLALVAAIAGWRGYRLVQKHVISNDIDRLFKWGIAILIIVIEVFLFHFYVDATALVKIKSTINGISAQVLALLTATFFVSVLTARSLQNVSYIRRFHRAKLWGSAAQQEWTIWISMAVLGLIMVVIAHLLGNAAIVILHSYTVPKKKSGLKQIIPPLSPGKEPHAQNGFPLGFIIALLVIIVFVLLLIALALYLRWQKLQRQAKQPKKQKAREDEEKDEDNEVHEVIFNWSLFLSQLLALVALLNPFRKRSRSGTTDVLDDLLLEEPMTRSIREIYRALLKKAANHGHARLHDETPYEFWQRLDCEKTLSEPELKLITEAYVLTRYAGDRSSADKVAHVKQMWHELKQKWL